jgi:hypothetical protein
LAQRGHLLGEIGGVLGQVVLDGGEVLRAVVLWRRLALVVAAAAGRNEGREDETGTEQPR